jgi:O-antigen/teichoic acid export membrane protein
MKKINSLIGSVGVKSLSAVLAIFSQIYIIKMAGEDGYGLYVKYVTVVSLMVLVAKFGADVGCVKKASIYFNENNKFGLVSLLNGSLLFSIVSSGFVAIVYFLVFNYEFSGVELFVGVVVGVAIPIFSGVMRGGRRYIMADAIESIFRPIVMIAVLTAMVWRDFGRDSVVYAYCLASVLTVAVYVRYISIENKVETWGIEIPRPNLYVLLCALLGYAIFQLDTLILSEYVGKVNLGGYNVACNYVRLVIFVPLIVAAQAQQDFVGLSGCTKEVYLKKVYSHMKVAFVCAVVATGFIQIFSEYILTATSDKYTAANVPLKILSIGHLFNSMTMIIFSALYMRGKEKSVFLCNAIGALFAIGGYIIFIPKYKEVAAASSASVAMAIIFIVAFYELNSSVKNDE